jgi:Hypervirulence associated proteins TUDOR domain
MKAEWTRCVMGRIFKIGDHVSWNSEAGRVTGRIVRVHTKEVNHKGYLHRASSDDPQYEIKSDKSDHIALHRGHVLRHLRR